jgi:cytochrome c peroxidase
MSRCLNAGAAAFLAVLGISGLSADVRATEQQLGQILYLDTNLSLHCNQSCNSCHDIQPVRLQGQPAALPAVGFVDPDNVRHGSAFSRG